MGFVVRDRPTSFPVLICDFLSKAEKIVEFQVDIEVTSSSLVKTIVRLQVFTHFQIRGKTDRIFVINIYDETV